MILFLVLRLNPINVILTNSLVGKVLQSLQGWPSKFDQILFLLEENKESFYIGPLFFIHISIIYQIT